LKSGALKLRGIEKLKEISDPETEGSGATIPLGKIDDNAQPVRLKA